MEKKLLYLNIQIWNFAVITVLAISLASCATTLDFDQGTEENYTMPREKDVMTQEDIKTFEAQFSSNERLKANTAADNQLYNDIEKEVVYFLNLARLNPKLFSHTFVSHYTHRPGYPPSNTFAERKQSLMNYLSTMEPLPPLVPNDTLWHFATDLSIAIPYESKIDNRPFDRSNSDCISLEEGKFSESISNGFVDNGLWYVLDMLVDATDNSTNLKNRRNLLDMDVNNHQDTRRHIGVRAYNHRNYGYAIVDFWSDRQRYLYWLGDALSGYDIEVLESQFNEDLLQKANTAANADYLTKDEKELYYYLNLARLAPQLFGKVFISNYKHLPGHNTIPEDFAERKQSLIDYLATMAPLPVLVPNDTLFEFADCFATAQGERGDMGHERGDTGCMSYRDGMFAECICYGRPGCSLWSIMDLLIDTGTDNASLGHRRIMLNIGETSPEGYYKYMGVAIRPHTIFKKISVLDFWSDNYKTVYLRKHP